MSIYAGTGIEGFSGDGGPATEAELAFPEGLAVDANGDVFIADSLNNRVRRVDANTGVITTYAGSGIQYDGSGFFGGYSGDGGPATSALLNFPAALALDSNGNLFIADSNNDVVRLVDNSPEHIITTYVGNGTRGTPGATNGDGGPATSARLNFQYYEAGLATDAAGNLYIADTNDDVVRVVDTSANHIITTYAGSPGHLFTYSGDGGPATSAGLFLPVGLSFDGLGNLFIVDRGNNRVRMVDTTPDHIITTVAGSGSLCTTYINGCGDSGSPTAASLNDPYDVFVDSAENLFITDFGTGRIRLVSPGPPSVISTYAGGGTGGDGGAATSAVLPAPHTLVADSAGDLFLANDFRVSRVDGSTQTITTYAGNDIDGTYVIGNGDNGPATQANFYSPFGLALDSLGNLYVADSGLVVRRVDGVTNTITTYAGTGAVCNPTTSPGCGDGGAAASATFGNIGGMATDSSGNLYISDTNLDVVRRVDAVTGTISTYAGTGVAGYSGDGGPATFATLSVPYGLAFDSQDNLYVADAANNVIRKIDNTAQHNITTYAFNGSPTFGGDGGAALSASMHFPAQVALDANGNLFVGGGYDNVVRRIDANDQSVITVAGDIHNLDGGFSGDGGPSTQAMLSNFGVAIDSNENLYIADAGNNRIRSVHLAPVANVNTSLLPPFGTVLPGAASNPGLIDITNNGLDDLNITNVTVPAGFTLQNLCINPATLAPTPISPVAGSCSLEVFFTPPANAAPGAVFSGNITFSTNDPTNPSFSLAVTGTAGALPGATLSVAEAGLGSGTVISSPSGIACPAVICTANFALGQTVTLTAIGGVGSVFTGWTVNGSNTTCPSTLPCTLTMSGDENVTATFGNASITVSGMGNGSGTITSSPSGINCTVTNGIASGTCTFSNFPGGTQTVTLTATATGNSTFAGWLGLCGSPVVGAAGTGPCQFPLSIESDIALSGPQAVAVFSGPAQAFAQGQVFVGSLDGMIFVYNPDGTLAQVLNSGNLAGEIYGMNFDQAGNLYAANPVANGVPDGTVEFFGNNASGPTTFGTYSNGAPSDVLIDPQGDVFVGACGGQASPISEFANAKSGAPTSTFFPAYQSCSNSGQFIELLDDNATMLYATGGNSVGNFDILYNYQNPDFATNLPGSRAYQIRELSDKSVIVADTTQIVRLSPAGSVSQTYTPGGGGPFYALAVNLDGLSFWTIDASSGKVYQVRLSDGALLNTINTGIPGSASSFSLGGIAILGQPQPGGADVSVSMNSAPTSVAGGAQVSYTITVTNNGPGDAFNVAMTDAFPSGVVFLSSATTLDSCTGTTTVTCTLGTMTSGQNATITIVVTPKFAGTLPNTVNVTSTTPDPNAANNSASTSTNVTANAVTLSVGEAGAGFGAVTSMPAGISCQPTCIGSFQQGGMVTLTATPAAGSTFVGWSGACSGTGSCIVTMTGNETVIANFTLTGTTACNAVGASIWIGGGSGSWNTASNWSTNAVPNGANATVCIDDGAAPAAVTINSSVEVGTLVIDAGSSLTIGNNTDLEVTSAIVNAGQITVSANGNPTYLSLAGQVTLTGGGSVVMTVGGNGNTPYIRQDTAGSTLTNVNNTISGRGQIGGGGSAPLAGFINQPGGTVNASSSGNGLLINSSGVVNQGLFEATGGGILQTNVSVNNLGGTISAGTSAQVQFLSGTDIQGGTLASGSGAGTFFGTANSNGVVLDGTTQGPVNNTATYTIQNNADTEILGTINNTGSFQVAANGNPTFLSMSGAVTLTGSGTVVMSIGGNGNTPYIRQDTAGSTLTNVNNTISGVGQVGGGGSAPLSLFVNQGVVSATGNALLLNAAQIQNQNLLQATASAVLQINTVVNNSGGNITANGGGAQVQFLTGARIEAGTLNTINGPAFFGTANSNGVVLDGITQGQLNNTATYTVANNADTEILGTINNTGSFQVAANGNPTFLSASGTVTLTGGGSVVMTVGGNGNSPYIREDSSNSTLTNVNNTISGRGQIGNNGLTFINQSGGLVNANSGGNVLLVNASGAVNQGQFQANGGGILQVDVTLNNAGGTITAGAGSQVQFLTGADIQGGTFISSSVSGTFFGTANSNGVVLDGITQGQLNNTATYTIQNNADTEILGTINNTGSFQVAANGNPTFLSMSGAVTLTGGGTVVMSIGGNGNSPYIRQDTAGSSLTNSGNSISGPGGLTIPAYMQTAGFIQIPSGVSDSVTTFSISGGIAQVDGTLSVSSGVSTSGTGVISGTGSLSSNTTNAGVIEAGDVPSPGVLNIPSSYTQNSTGSFEVAIGGTTVGTQYSQVKVAGAASLAGALSVRLIGGFAPSLGNSFTILTASAIAGQFSSINSPALPSGLAWSVAYNSTSVVLSVVSASPTSYTLTIAEPGSGSGTVTDDLGQINCVDTAGVVTGTCSASYQSGTVVVLTATPAVGTAFNGWSTCGGTGPCSITMNSAQTEQATFGPVIPNYAVTITEIGTGTGSVTDNLGGINCSESNGVVTGTCSASYASGTQISLNESATSPSTFGGWGNACFSSGTGTSCNLTVSSALNVTANFIPPPVSVDLPFNAGSNVSQQASFDCPSNPTPTPGNPCTDANAHAFQLQLSQVNSSFNLTVTATEVPPSQFDGLCEVGNTVLNDFDCRFSTFFGYGTDPNGNTITPFCYPYANGNCVHYDVYVGTPGNVPDPGSYSGPVNWKITFNNGTFTPPAPYWTGSSPRLYEDPDSAQSPSDAIGTVCTELMTIGGVAQNYSCQFEFDITTFFDSSEPVDPGIGGTTKHLSDVVVAFPPTTSGQLSVTSTPDAASVNAGSTIGFTITVTNIGPGTEPDVTLNDPLPAGASWSLSTYTGPGSCGITGSAGSQVLACTFGDLAANASATLHVSGASAAAGSYVNVATVASVVNEQPTQQVLSAAGVTVEALATSFSGLTASQSIPFGTSSVNLTGTLSAPGPTYPSSGETVSVTINGSVQSTTLGANGVFSLTFPTAAIPPSGTPYTITYSYAGDTDFAPATDTSTTLTVTQQAQTIAFTGAPETAVYNSSFPVSATATSGLAVTITASGACSINGTTVTMISGTGTCQLAANQAGNADYSPAPQQAASVTAEKASTTTTITSNTPNPSVTGQAVTISVSVTGNGTPTGSVQVSASTGESCTVTSLTAGAGSCQITFQTVESPMLTAVYSGDTNFSTSTSLSVQQTVTASTSTLKISPTSVDFGNVNFGAFGVQSITLTNTGTSTINIRNIAISQGNLNEFFAFSPFCNFPLSAGRSCIIFVTFFPAPHQSDTQSATLIITDSAAGSPQSVPMTATIINPQASLNVHLLTFGTQKANTTSAAKSVTLTNTGTTPLNLKDVDIFGDFAIASGTTCTDGSTVLPSANCIIYITFTPQSKGQRSGRLSIRDNALFSPQEILLFGTGN